MSKRSKKVRQSSFKGGNISTGGGNINISHVTGHGIIGANNSVSVNIQRNYSSASQFLEEAIAEIQRLLRQIEQTNPSATLEEKQAFVNLGISLTVKRQVIAALKEGKRQKFYEMLSSLDDSSIDVGKAVVKGWLQE